MKTLNPSVVILLIYALTYLPCPCRAATGGEFEIDLEVFVPGGELSAGAEFEGMAVLGQPQVEDPMVGGEFTLTEGFLNRDTASVPVELVSFTVE